MYVKQNMVDITTDFVVLWWVRFVSGMYCFL